MNGVSSEKNKENKKNFLSFYVLDAIDGEEVERRAKEIIFVFPVGQEKTKANDSNGLLLFFA